MKSISELQWYKYFIELQLIMSLTTSFSLFFRPLLLSSCIFPEDDRSETLWQSIVHTIKEKAKLLDRWSTTHEKAFPSRPHDIPPSSDMHLSKAGKGGSSTTDTCHGARLFSSLLVEEIELAAKEKAQENGEDGSDILVCLMNCHHHLRNVWIGAMNKRLSTYLNEILASDLDAIDYRYRVSTMMDMVLRAIDKEFSLPANYPKGHGDMFKHWMNLNHPGALLVPVQRTSGSRQDLVVEGAAAVYWNRK